jgi:putative ATPase
MGDPQRSRTVGGTAIVVTQGDITSLDVDVVVNAANGALAHGGGVAAAIAHAGGPAVDEESAEWVRQHGPVGVGQAAITTAGAMPARYVVHVVGPVYHGGDSGEEDHLRAAVRAALDATAGLDCSTAALPAISAGIYGYPRDDATAVIASECIGWARAHPDVLAVIHLVAYDPDTAASFTHSLHTP